MKKTILSLIILTLFTGNVLSAGSSGGDTKSKYDQAVKLIKTAKKNEEKGKKDISKVLLNTSNCMLWIEDNVLLTASYFKKLEDQKIVSFVSNLESNEIELSYNWIQKYNIHTKSESDNIYKSVMNSIYNFKYHKVDALILKIKNEIKEGGNSDDELLNLLGEQMSYERIKKKLSDKLGRIILK